MCSATMGVHSGRGDCSVPVALLNFPRKGSIICHWSLREVLDINPHCVIFSDLEPTLKIRACILL